MSSSIDGVSFKQQVKQAGYTLEEFARELGIAKTTFYYYRTGARSIPHELRPRIEALLGCSFQALCLPHRGSNLIVLQPEQQRASQR
jgi:transcriptional regulator with XRE-family HTH domain